MAEQIGNRNLKEQEGRDAMIAAAIIVPVVTLAAVGYVVAGLMGLSATTSPIHLLSLTTVQDFGLAHFARIWGITPNPGIRFDVVYGLTLTAVGSLARLVWSYVAQARAKRNPQLVPMRQLSRAHLRRLTSSGGLGMVALLWLVVVGATSLVAGNALGGVVLGTALSVELSIYLAYQLAGGQASAELPKDRFVLGNTAGSFVMAPPNQALMIFAGPRSGKSSGLIIPNVLHLDESSLVFTSTRSDILVKTAKHRSQLGTVWLYDPMHLTNPLPDGVQRINWTPMSGCEFLTVALRHSDEFTTGVSEGTDDKNGFFAQSASRLLASAFHVAAIHHLPMSDIPKLIQERSLQSLLGLAQQKSEAQVLSIIQSLVGFRELNSIQATAAATTSIFSTKFIANPDPSDVTFDPLALLNGQNTLAIIAKSDLGGTLTASPLTTSLLTDIYTEIHALSQAQSDGRLPISHCWLLDEFFALGGLSALPQMASESAGRNHHLAIALQSAEQLTVLYGQKADTLHDLFGTKMAGSGVSSVPTLRRLEMVGGGDAAERQDRDPKKSPMKGDRLLSHEIAAMREHHWFTISQSGSKELYPMTINGNAYWKVSPFKELSEGLDALLATPLARWFSRVRQAKRELATKRTSPSTQTGSTIKAEIGATEELVGEEYSLIASEAREAVRNGVLAIKTRIGGTLGGLTRSRIAPLSVQSGPSVERPFRSGKEKGTGDVLDRGFAGSAEALADDDGPAGALLSVGLPGAVGGHPLPLRSDDDESSTFPCAGSVKDDGRASALVLAPPAVATTTVPRPPAVVLPPRLRINQHYTRCDICKQAVPPGEGWIWKEDGKSSWSGRHKSCPAEE